MSTIIITAANGFIGQKLVHFLKDRYHVIALVRKLPASVPGVEYQLWDGRSAGDWAACLEGALAVVNLAGKSVNCRYTSRNKSEIYASRLESTAVIGQVIHQCRQPPKVWLNASSATIYAHAETIPHTETEHTIGQGFSVDVCCQWETRFNSYSHPEVRQIALRTAIVLGRNGGVMMPFKRLAYAGAGGRMGKGNQQFSWIHEDDLCRTIEHLITHETSAGVYNLSAPAPLRNDAFMRLLREQLNVPFGLPLPGILLETGAFLIGTETELMLKSRYVLPERLLSEGFQFMYPDMRSCLRHC